MLSRPCLRKSVRLVPISSTLELASRTGQAAARYGLARVTSRSPNRSFCQTASNGNSANIKITSDELFKYTEGRWLADDKTNQGLRYVKFDVHELCRQAAETVGDGTKVVRVDRLPAFNSRVLLLTMEDGKEVIAKIRCPIAGPVILTIASEVATIAFGIS